MPRKLTRDTRQAVVAGVAAGLADYFDLDPILVRLGFVLLCFFGGSGALLYVVAWVLMPSDAAPQEARRTDPPPDTAGAAPAEDLPPLDGDSPPAPAGGEAGDPDSFEDPGLKGHVDRVAREASEAGARVAETVRRGVPEGTGRGRLIFGMILIGIGLLFLVDRFLPFQWFWVWDMWPMALIGVGVLILLNAGRGANER